jgi:hypothetical protein
LEEILVATLTCSNIARDSGVRVAIQQVRSI